MVTVNNLMFALYKHYANFTDFTVKVSYVYVF